MKKHVLWSIPKGVEILETLAGDLYWVERDTFMGERFWVGKIGATPHPYMIVLFGNRFGMMKINDNIRYSAFSWIVKSPTMCSIRRYSANVKWIMDLPLDFTYEKDKLIEAINEAMVVDTVVDSL